MLLMLCLGAGFPVLASADDATPESARLAAVLRQVDAIEGLVAHESLRPREERSRYYFDYNRFGSDLERIRAGIRDYLSPSRAQPRDSAVLSGDYRQPTESASDDEEATP